MTASTYPVHVAAHLDSGLNRWLWLVKWLLALPHYVVLAFLWLAFVVLSMVAFFAILFTGRYPRAIFDFNVGVLRWSWRVAYYTYGALGTDRYPPFTLAETQDYPAHLEVDYPEHLSRGLVLVKWWLLAIPHYLVLGFFLGGGLYVAADPSVGDRPLLWGSGLIGLLVLVAAVVLLFTGRYPKPIYDVVLGMNRWVLRVAAYAGLMTDRYPPFRLDMGGDDPDGRLTLGTPTPTPAMPAAGDGGQADARPHTPTQWTAGRLVALVTGSLVLLVSLGAALGGAALAVADRGLRDSSGFLMSGEATVTTASYAVTSESLQLATAGAPDWLLPDALLGDLKLTVDPATDRAVFVGVAPTADVAGYLGGVGHARVVDATGGPVVLEGTLVYRDTPGGAPEVRPGDVDIWAARSAGTGEHSLVWTPSAGDWTVVLMNADGSAGVEARVSAGLTAPSLGWGSSALLVVAGFGLLLAVALLVLALYGLGGSRESATGPADRDFEDGRR